MESAGVRHRTRLSLITDPLREDRGHVFIAGVEYSHGETTAGVGLLKESIPSVVNVLVVVSIAFVLGEWAIVVQHVTEKRHVGDVPAPLSLRELHGPVQG